MHKPRTVHNQIPVSYTHLDVYKRQDNYHLEKDEDFLSLTVSGIETSGHFSHFKYRINDNQWISFFGNNLNLKLSGGKNYFEIFSVCLLYTSRCV